MRLYRHRLYTHNSQTIKQPIAN